MNQVERMLMESSFLVQNQTRSDYNAQHVQIVRYLDTAIKKEAFDHLSQMQNLFVKLSYLFESAKDKDEWQKVINKTNEYYCHDFCNSHSELKASCSWCGGDAGYGPIVWPKNSEKPSDFCCDECKEMANKYKKRGDYEQKRKNNHLR